MIRKSTTSPMSRREEAEKLARQIYHCDARFEECGHCADSIDDIGTAFLAAEQRTLREAAETYKHSRQTQMLNRQVVEWLIAQADALHHEDQRTKT